MGKASRNKRAGSARERIAAQRVAARRAEIRNRVMLASLSGVVVIAIVVVLIVVKVNAKPTSKGASNGPTGATLSKLVDTVTSVPATTLDAVGAGSITSGLTAVSGEPELTSNGKPEMLYMGAEYCPYCAAERWAMVVALSRFGTFSGLHTVHSSSTDVNPNTPTFSFYKSTYTSKYLSFVPVEELSNIPNSSTQGYTTLQTATAAQQALATKYDSAGSIPFIDIGNRYTEVGNLSPYGPGTLTGKNWTQIAAVLDDPSNAIAQGIDGSANYLTAAICKLTNNQPASACTSVVQKLEDKL
jgi:thiol-disulfide isomerase/thioredoxin